MLLHQNSQGVPNWPWKMIWKTKAPVKAACFGWLAARDACLTQNKLQRGFPLCRLADVIFAKLRRKLLSINSFTVISEDSPWELFLTIMGVSLVIPQKISNLLEVWQAQKMKRNLKEIWKTIPVCIL